MIPRDLENVAPRQQDEIIREVRAIRESYVEECNYEMHEIFRRARERAAKEGAKGNTREPRRIEFEETA